MLKATFVRTVGQRDRIYVTRSDGSEVDPAAITAEANRVGVPDRG
jgi:hypothetical protein